MKILKSINHIIFIISFSAWLSACGGGGSSADTTAATVSSTTPAAAATGVARNTAITDLSGNPLAADVSWSFTTAEGAWRSAALIEDNDAGTASSPQIALDASGNALAVWH